MIRGAQIARRDPFPTPFQPAPAEETRAQSTRMSTPLVTIYAPSGAEEKHSNLNAVDLVRNCGYTYQPGKVHAPTEGAPYAKPETGKLPSRAQEALDSVGTGSEVGGNGHIDSLSAPAGQTTATESILNPTTIKTTPAPAIAEPAPAPAPVEAPAPAPVEAPAAAAEPAPVEAVTTPEPVVEAPAAPKARQQRAKKSS